ncbi:MAG: endonuclease/exonuclease/phosphatase family protein [archaeon]
MPRLISYNIQYCIGLEGKTRDYFKVWRLLREKKNTRENIIEFLKQHKPDLVALVEVDFGSVRTKRQNQAQIVAKALNLPFILSKVRYQKKLIGRVFNHAPILARQGTAVLSKHEIHGRIHWFKRGIKRLVLEANIYIPKKVSIFVVHLSLTKKVRAKQLHELAHIVAEKKTPSLVVGDFNTAASYELRHFLRKTGFIMHPAEPSFPAFRPKRALDYALSSPNILIKKHVLLPFNGSDHLPLLVDFEMKK